MEKETYKAAKDLLEKYDPNSEIVKVLFCWLILIIDIVWSCFNIGFWHNVAGL